MMNDQIKSALKQWHNTNGFDDVVLFDLSENGESEPFSAIVTLAEAYAVEHPADDDEPFTCQWLVDVGFNERYRCFDFGDITLSQIFHNEIPVGWVLYLRWFEARMSKCPKTRGEVRRLCKALGYSLKEHTTIYKGE